MKIEIIYDGEGDLIIIYPDGTYIQEFCEYDLPESITEKLKNEICRYKENFDEED